MGVAIFLICSGYGLAESGFGNSLQDKINWWIKRLSTVLMPYTIVRTCYYATGTRPGILDRVKDYCLITPTYSLGWYLKYLFLWYLIFFTLENLVRDKRIRQLLYCFIGVAIFVLSPSELQAEQAFSFPCGVMLSNHKGVINKGRSMPIAIFCLLCGVVAFVLKQKLELNNQYFVWLLQLGYKLPWAMMIITMLLVLTRINSFAVFQIIGMYSYELYLIHGYYFDLLHTLGNIPYFLCVISITSIGLHYIDKGVMRKVEDRLIYIHDKDRAS